MVLEHRLAGSFGVLPLRSEVGVYSPPLNKRRGLLRSGTQSICTKDPHGRRVSGARDVHTGNVAEGFERGTPGLTGSSRVDRSHLLGPSDFFCRDSSAVRKGLPTVEDVVSGVVPTVPLVPVPAEGGWGESGRYRVTIEDRREPQDTGEEISRACRESRLPGLRKGNLSGNVKEEMGWSGAQLPLGPHWTLEGTPVGVGSRRGFKVQAGRPWA